MNIRNKRGITLVALVITIIILLILAGISIQALKQTNLFDKTKQAKNAMENSQNKENTILGDYENKILESVTRESSSITTNAANNYSIDEQVIGKWLDGKPLYQKSFVMDNSYTSEVAIDSASGYSIKVITDVYMSTVQPTLDKIIQMTLQNNSNTSTNVSYQYSLSMNYSNGKLRAYDNYNVGYINYALYPGSAFTIQYTKTTDTTNQ